VWKADALAGILVIYWKRVTWNDNDERKNENK
jgi:hypothetical protein